MSIQAVLFIAFLASCDGYPFSDRNFEDQGVVSEELVPISLNVDNEFHNRRRRAADSFPDKLSFNIESRSGTVTLNLTKNIIIKIPPMFYWDGQKLINETLLKIERDFALYQGNDMGANAMVRFPNDDHSKFELHANYIVGADWFSIQPVPSRQKRSIQIHNPDFSGSSSVHPAPNSRVHILLKQRDNSLNFENDMVLIQDQASVGNGGKIQIQRIKEEPELTPSEPLVLKPHSQRKKRRTSDKTEFKRSTHRRKRQGTTLYLEYLVCIDYANFAIWKSMTTGATDKERNEEAKNAITKYYLYLVNGIDTRFKTAQTPQGDLRVAIAGLVLAMDRKASNWTENNVISGNLVADGDTLLNFAQWANSQKSSLPSHDHTALFTGYNLAESASNSRTIGIAYLSRVCNTYASSINEETYNAIAIHISAHELGHSVGASHDSGWTCPATNMNLMAGSLPDPSKLSLTIASNTYKFSSCSRSQIGTYIGQLSANCLFNTPLYLDVAMSLPYSPDEQCRLTYAPASSSSICREQYPDRILKWSEVCHKLRCRIPGSTSCSTHFSHDRTPCGNFKWCQQGICVSSLEAYDVPDICPFGDDPGYVCRPEECSRYPKQTREGTCCQTCLVGTPETTTTSTTTTSTMTTTTPTTTTTTLKITTPEFKATVATTTAQPTTPTSTTTTTQPTTTTTTTQPTTTTTTTTTSTTRPTTTTTTQPTTTTRPSPTTVTPTTIASLLTTTSTPFVPSNTSPMSSSSKAVPDATKKATQSTINPVKSTATPQGTTRVTTQTSPDPSLVISFVDDADFDLLTKIALFQTFIFNMD